MNCLITGGSGFIGKHLVDYIRTNKSYDKIIIIDTVEPHYQVTDVEFIKCDIRQQIDITLKEKIDVCFHLAAVAKEPGYEWEMYFEANYSGTRNVIAFCEKNGINNIVFTSTMMVFRAGEVRNNESSLTAPDTGYGISKILAEAALKEWAAAGNNRRLRIVRPGVVFGKGENGNYTRLYKALKKNMFFYTGKKTTIKGSIYVKDLVRFICFLADDLHNNVVYHMVYPYQLTIDEICRTICSVFGWKRIIPTVPYKMALMMSYPFEMLSLLGFKTNIHHRRIQKLYFSTDISADLAQSVGFELKYTLDEALKDWANDCLPGDIS
ncbi:MAG: NAD-dependent epimerase/dehydratase family protein [Ignavibacteriales bacterium]